MRFGADGCLRVVDRSLPSGEALLELEVEEGEGHFREIAEGYLAFRRETREEDERFGGLIEQPSDGARDQRMLRALGYAGDTSDDD